MSRTRRRQKHGDDSPAKDQRDGRGGIFGKRLPPNEFAVEVVRRDRRARESEADKIQRGAVDPDDTPVKPKPLKLWQWWKRW